MEPYDLKGENDLGALSNEQQEKLNKYKVSIDLSNLHYFDFNNWNCQKVKLIIGSN